MDFDRDQHATTCETDKQYALHAGSLGDMPFGQYILQCLNIRDLENYFEAPRIESLRYVHQFIGDQCQPWSIQDPYCFSFHNTRF